jgi:hypothetical protein
MMVGGTGTHKGKEFFMKKNIQFLTFSLSSILLLSSVAHASYVVGSPNQSRLMLEQTKSVIEEGEEIRREIKENGYYPTYSVNAVNLIAFKDKKGTPFLRQDSDPYFKILRLSPSEFPKTFPFDGITSVDENHLLGFAPSGTLDQGNWTGVTAYFNDDRFGTCRLEVFDMLPMNGTAFYDSKYTTYDINGKPTVSNAEGSNDSGFVYNTSWTGKRYEKMLECANKKPFDKQVLQDLVAYAKKIDNDLPDEP